MSSTMKAIRVDTPGALPTVVAVPVPHPGPGQVLVRMAAAPINPSDLALLAGRAAYATYPAIPGVEGSGTVVGAGPGLLARRLVGRRVACVRSAGLDGTWAEYLVTRATSCVALRRSLSLEQGATLLVNPMTALAFFDLRRRGRHRAMVNTAAASQLGRMIHRLAMRKGVPLINIVRGPAQAELLRSAGARHVLDSTVPDFDERLSGLSRDLGATLVFDAVSGELTQRLLDAAPPRAVIVIYATLSREPARIQPSSLWTAGKRVEGFYLGSWSSGQGLLRILSLTREAQRLAGTDLSTVIRRRFPLTAVDEALQLYRSGMTEGKILLNP